ncbi:MAG: HXXEE domain-containing protein [bacterium]|nr:HXXEE domain-containing protein [bacterium]
MISTRLKNIFILSVPVFIAHGLEEYFAGFYAVDSHVDFMFRYFYTLPTPQAIFLLFQIMLWVTLIIAALLISGEKWQLRLLVIPGLVYIYELHHFLKALVVGGYYPGLVTAVAFPIIGVLFWKELIKEVKTSKTA